ncbi:MAG: hypothetical protein JHC22_06730 [Thermoproteus sp.]|nr:hypothetical protein [Thermoproteus sp.]
MGVSLYALETQPQRAKARSLPSRRLGRRYVRRYAWAKAAATTSSQWGRGPSFLLNRASAGSCLGPSPSASSGTLSPITLKASLAPPARAA